MPTLNRLPDNTPLYSVAGVSRLHPLAIEVAALKVKVAELEAQIKELEKRLPPESPPP
jgi:hypothetical protein